MNVDNMDEQLDDNLSIYSGSTIEDIIVSSSDEWENDSDDSEKESYGINQLTDDCKSCRTQH